MKKTIVSVFMLTLFFLLSCDFEAISQLIDKASAKLSDRDLKYGQEVKEGHQGGGEEDLKELEKSIKNLGEEAKVVANKVFKNDLFVSADSINEVPVNPDLYPYQRPIKLKEKDVVPSAKEEKEAERAIQEVKSLLKKFGFSSLIENAHSIKDKYKKMKTDLYDLNMKTQNEMNLLFTTNRADFSKNKEKRKVLNHLKSQLKNEISNVEDIMGRIDIAIGEIASAKALFEKAQTTLNEAITNRLEKAANRYLRDISITLSRDARRYAESSLEQVISYSSKIGEATGLIKNTEQIIQDTKYSLAKA